MTDIEVHGRRFEKFIDKATLDLEVSRLADQLNARYHAVGDPPLLVGILNGSFIFMADLIRQLTFECKVQFIRIESSQGMERGGIVKMEADVSQKWKNQHIIVIEDIIDTGNTMQRFLPVLASHQPKSVFVCALLFKEAALEVAVQLDAYCFNIPKDFVLGYGLDYDGLGRNLPEIYRLAE